MHPKKERTFVILKPDAVQRGLVGEIISRFERTGLKMVAMKMGIPTEAQCFAHYNKDEAWFIRKGEGIIENKKKIGLPVEKEPIEYGRDIIKGIVKYMTASPVVMMIWEGNQSVAVIKKLVGGTEPSTSDVGTIRGDFTIDSYHLSDFDGSRAIRNLVHCTDNPGESDHEISVWFTEAEIINYRLVQEAMLYDVNLDGMME
ncbi:MAG: nucleoside-diphosphate kinase [Candidatus Pacebacteria bacterium]|nr:nucleoside-diphosphate kinase [Candidatus Paceibacterota bacterium]